MFGPCGKALDEVRLTTLRITFPGMLDEIESIDPKENRLAEVGEEFDITSLVVELVAYTTMLD